MNIKDSKLFFLEEDCEKQFGSDKGKTIYSAKDGTSDGYAVTGRKSILT